MKNQAGVEESGETLAEAAGATCDQHNSNKSGSGIGMATGGCLPSAELQTAHSNARINVCDFNLLHNYFLHMFESSEDTNVLKDKHKKNKKSKAKCPKSREKRPMEPLSSLYYSVPEIKISRNASWFAMFASVRRTCLEHQSRAATLLQVVFDTFIICFCRFFLNLFIISIHPIPFHTTVAPCATSIRRWSFSIKNIFPGGCCCCLARRRGVR